MKTEGMKAKDIKQALVTKLVTVAGIVSVDEQEAKINEIVEKIPSSLRNQYPEDKNAAALEYFPIYFKKFEDNSETVGATGSNGALNTQESGQVATSKVVKRRRREYTNLKEIPKAAEEVFEKMASNETVDAMNEKSRNTFIKLLLFSREAPSVLAEQGLLPKTQKLQKEKFVDKWEKWEKNLVQTPENIKNFNDFKAAVEAEQEVKLRYSDSMGDVEGVVLDTLANKTKGKATSVTEVKTMNTLASFMFSEVPFHIFKGSNGLEATLDVYTTETKTQEGASSKTDRVPHLKVTIGGKKEAKDLKGGADLRDIIREVATAEDGTPITKKGSVTVADYSFRVNTQDTDADGKIKTRLIRPRVTIDNMPQFRVKKDGAYNYGDYFTDGKNSPAVRPTSGAAKADFRNKLKLVYGGLFSGDFVNEKIQLGGEKINEAMAEAQEAIKASTVPDSKVADQFK